LLFNYRISSAICRLFRVGLRRLPRCDGRKPPAAKAMAAKDFRFWHETDSRDGSDVR